MRQYVMELIGTFFLTMAVTLAPGNPIAIGLMLMAMIFIGEHISGAHFNPAISCAVFLRGALKSDVMFWYWGAQTAGALLAHVLFKMVTGNVFPLDINPEIPILISFIIEILFTSVLALVFLTVTTTARYRTLFMDAPAIGLTLLALVSIGGGFLNPAISVGSMVLSLFQQAAMITWQGIFISIAAPLVGGVLAAYGFKYLNPGE